MNIIKFLESLANESVLKTKGSRRDSLEQFKSFGAKTAMAAVPFGLAAVALKPQKANAATTAFFAEAAETPTQALQLALTLEYLEDEFYRMALAAPNLIPAQDRVIFQQIADHEFDHVAFLAGALGDDAPAKPEFDFTGSKGGTSPVLFSPFTDYPTFLALAQAFEDTGVRAYKGQAGNLISEPDLLEYALQIHSVEARHASQVRRLRNQYGLADQKGWITANDRGNLPEQAQAVYDGEQNLLQGDFNTASVTLPISNSDAGAIAGSESFDEPLTGAQATAIASLFIVP